MANDFKIDGHKLIYHPQRVAEWQIGKNIYPIEIEIGLSGGCNHRCTFCAFDYLNYNPVFMDQKILLQNLGELQSKGLRSVIYSGEGEPLLNKNASEIINMTKSYGIDVAMSTNGVLLTKEFSAATLKSFSWIRFSIAGIHEEVYQNIHRSKDGDLEKVLYNLAKAVEIKNEQKLDTTLGVQLLLIPENQKEVLLMAKRMKEIGVDYFSIKPYSQHLFSKNIIKLDYEKLIKLEKELKKYNSDTFKVYFRAQAMKNLRHQKNYDKCRGLSFMVHMDAKGSIYPCCAYAGIEKMSYGNIYKNSFIDIWEGEKRKNVLDKINKMDIKRECREICRLDQINEYLHELDNPNKHVNFI